ncbi:KGK domain-containing protein [Leptothermofonsia sp. ETS-13]|uniref:KGK domain-containing protein n=1 Tax=Leptothermofonsia sp. ETS-13 TaxID=3035696 RepID=UPI003B9E94E2
MQGRNPWLGAKPSHLLKAVACEVLQPGNTAPQKGKLKLRLNLEFCPEVSEVVTSNPVMQPIDVPQKVSVAGI